MPLKQVMEVIDLLDSARITGHKVGELLTARGCKGWEVETVKGARASTDFLTITLPGTDGRATRGNAPTLGIVGRLGGIGARPAIPGMVSDADGAIVALAVALKLIDMRAQGDPLKGDVVIGTHISPMAPPHTGRQLGPVRMMEAPVDQVELFKREVRSEMEAILSVDATKGNRVINQRGIAITPTVKEGYLLPPANDLLDILQNVTGAMPAVVPLTTQDIVGADELRHVNSIVMPSTITKAPVVGVATIAAVAVPGIATGANQPADLELAARFCIEVAKAYGRGECRFFVQEDFDRLVALYGPMNHLQTAGRKPPARAS